MRVPRSDDLLPDRVVEVDLDWFHPEPTSAAGRRSVLEFVERVAPLWTGHRELRGVIVNVGFLVDVVTEFGGALDQRLPLRSRRYEGWSTATYRHLGELAGALRTEAAGHGIGDVRVGIFVAALGQVVTGGDLYDLRSDWYDRHPELYPLDVSPLPGPDLDPRVPLAADEFRYASRPDGVTAGLSFGELIGDQWAALSRACDLDLLHLRDGFWGPMLYTRRGPSGVVAGADVDDNLSWTEAITDLFARVKHSRPEALVMAYTSGIGATAEWRSGCVDTETVLAGGGVDVLIDQTWGGAWQDWWDDWWKGWTNQHANLLSHGAAVRGAAAPVKHYKLIETWDGWEPFDTVHDVPEKLRWAMWAWSHAAIVTPDGLEVPDGTYISWMNDRDRRLLDERTTRWLATELDHAERSAASMTGIGGPLAVFDRHAIDALHRGTPRATASEHLEDAIALLLKWGVPILGATRAEWLDRIDHQHGAIVQLGEPVVTASEHATPERPHPPTMVVGRADTVDADLLARIGASVDTDAPRRLPGYHRESVADGDLRRAGWVHLAGDVKVATSADSAVLASAAGHPTLVARGDAAWWQPPELADPGNPLLPRSQYGSVASAVQAARWWNARGVVRVHPVPAHLPIAVQWWHAGEDVLLLAGNLETGWIGDSRTRRSFVCDVHAPGRDARRVIAHVETAAEGCLVAALRMYDDVDRAVSTAEVVAASAGSRIVLEELEERAP